ncbi:uncharacterized protein SOCE26_063800 [Sorangium cellulosum]|uniref:Uncharacterized protein n=1 Tax=Sorangium cellulosum TaxID=56 RepID=A0A2L0F046_SORCE|nr:hypothetical protein [Sorangium cellulosum]AUX44910.1 uncharacterized protein SOCE26_063800 [Sorangium cellulosum]
MISVFAAVCPYRFEVGRSYPVEVSLWALDGLVLEQPAAPVAAPRLLRRGDGFGYLVVGRLDGRVLDAGIKFDDPLFEREFAYLSGQTVEVEVDRIEAAFLVE